MIQRPPSTQPQSNSHTSPNQEPEEVGKSLPQAVGYNVASLRTQFPNRREEVVSGILRRGEIMNIIGAPKTGKSWFAYGLCLAIASGNQWFGRSVTQGRVILLDNELHPEELSHRVGAVAKAMNIDLADLNDQMVVYPMRGLGCTIKDISILLRSNFKDIPIGLVVIDAFYRVLPSGMSENSNTEMADIYNKLDSIALEIDAPIALNHHTSKGDQSQKAVTDVGSGAGAMTRATDTHLILRPHRLENCVVLDGVVRSNTSINPKTLCFDWPLWIVKDGIEAELKPSGKERTQAKNDAEADEIVLGILRNESMTQRKVQSESGFGGPRTARTVARLKREKKIMETTDKSLAIVEGVR